VLRAVLTRHQTDYFPRINRQTDFERVPNGGSAILSYQEVRRLLNAAAEARDLVPYYAARLFAGVAIRVASLELSDVDLTEGHILIPREVAKNTRPNRYISPTCLHGSNRTKRRVA